VKRKLNLIVAAHPDDEILGCGGVMAKEESIVLILTNGADGRYLDISSHLNQAKLANDFLGVKELIIKDFPNQGLETIPLIKITQTIEEIIKRYNPTRVFTHCKNDVNFDHKIVYQATLTATRSLPDSEIEEVLSYYVPSSTEWSFEGFEANYFINIDIEKKINAMKYYKSEIKKYPHPRSLKGLKTIAKFFGIQSGMDYAEAFKLVRKVSK
jgi:LmbE family N-acetylglucosaminyl deacetylase